MLFIVNDWMLVTNTAQSTLPSNSQSTALQRIVGKHRAHYLGLVMLFVRRELKIKYRGTFLGYLWSILNPLLFMAIISAVLGRLVNSIENYSLYVLCGILTWNFTTLTITVGTHSIVQNAGLLRKIKIPIWVFPMVPAGTAFTNFILALLPFSIVCLVKGAVPPWQIVFLPLVLGLYSIFLYGVTIILSSLNVFFRDIAHMLEPVLQLCLYATPIFYSRKTLPDSASLQFILSLNPFTYFVETIRGIMFHGPDPVDLNHILIIFALTFVSIGLGGYVYKTCKPRIVFNL